MNSTGAGTLLAVQNDTTRTDSAIVGDAYSPQNGSAGVFGAALAKSGQVFGVEGTAQSASGSGVYGVNGVRSATGSNYSGNAGIWGDSGTIGFYGVFASADGGNALYAVNNSSLFPSSAGLNVATSGLAGGVFGVSNSPQGFGALGVAIAYSQTLQKDEGFQPTGVIGDTGSSGGIGVWGTADSGYAVVGENNGPYVSGLFLNQSSTLSYALEAGTLNNHCLVDTIGDLTCTGSKSAAVHLPDNRWVRLYAVESPDNWFEDFGSGTLANGAATVNLDPTFAQTVNANVEYHVFVTPKGDSEGLYVANESASGFEVHEQRGGHSNIAFDYRIVGKRKGYENIRLEDVTEKQAQLAAMNRQLTKTNSPAIREQLDRMLHPSPSAVHERGPAVRTAVRRGKGRSQR